MLLSSLCTNQITAAILTLGVNVLMYLSETLHCPQAGTSAYLTQSAILGFLPSSSRLGDFANGIVQPVRRIVYFVAFTALFFLTDRAMGKAPPRKG